MNHNTVAKANMPVILGVHEIWVGVILRLLVCNLNKYISDHKQQTDVEILTMFPMIK